MEINLPGPCTSILWQLVGLQSRDTWRNYANQQSVKTPVLDKQERKRWEPGDSKWPFDSPVVGHDSPFFFRVTVSLPIPKRVTNSQNCQGFLWEFPTSDLGIGIWGSGDRVFWNMATLSEVKPWLFMTLFPTMLEVENETLWRLNSTSRGSIFYGTMSTGRRLSWVLNVSKMCVCSPIH